MSNEKEIAQRKSFAIPFGGDVDILAKELEEYQALAKVRPEWKWDGGEECPECGDEVGREEAPESWWVALCMNCSIEFLVLRCSLLSTKLRALGADPDGDK